LPDGTILGCYHDHDKLATMRGVIIGRDGASEIDAAVTDLCREAVKTLRLPPQDCGDMPPL
jgi:hypothetical protein